MIGKGESNGLEETRKRLPELLAVFRETRRVLILTHDNPDPDAIASAAGLKYLARRSAGNPAAIAFGGVIGRPENKALIDILGVRLVPLSRVFRAEFDALVLVDHQPGRRWPLLSWKMPVAAVIDHHPRVRWSVPARFGDVRKGYGANATVITQYLQASGLPVPKFLATALMYGVLSDTQEFSRGATHADLEAHAFLFPRCDYVKIHAIRHPVVTPGYLGDYWTGVRNACRFKDAAVTYAGTVMTPEIVAEIADRLVSVKGIRWSLAAGGFEDTLFLSVRHRGGRKDAGRLVRNVVGRHGSAGGHGFMAGAQIGNLEPDALESKAAFMIDRFLKHLYPGVDIPAQLPSLLPQENV